MTYAFSLQVMDRLLIPCSSILKIADTDTTCARDPYLLNREFSTAIVVLAFVLFMGIFQAILSEHLPLLNSVAKSMWIR